MAGGFLFARSYWGSGWSAVYYVMRFLAEHVRDPAMRDEITDRVENNVALLDLRGPEQAPLVDIIANDLLRYGPPASAKPEYQAMFTRLMVELVDCAREQQDYNRNPGGQRYYRLGPNPADGFDLDLLTDSVRRSLEQHDSVRIDVRYYTAEQCAAIRSHLVGPRVSLVGEAAAGQDAVNLGGAD